MFMTDEQIAAAEAEAERRALGLARVRAEEIAAAAAAAPAGGGARGYGLNDLVEAKVGRKWYPARVTGLLGDGNYTVRYDDDDDTRYGNNALYSERAETELRARRRGGGYKLGDLVEAKVGTEWCPARVTGLLGDGYYTVRYDDDDDTRYGNNALYSERMETQLRARRRLTRKKPPKSAMKNK